MSAGLGAGTAGIAKMLFEAGAIVKSLVPEAVPVVSVFAFAVPASFCCAQRGRAKSAPNTTVAHQLRIKFLPKFVTNDPMDPPFLFQPLDFCDAGRKTPVNTQRLACFFKWAVQNLKLSLVARNHWKQAAAVRG